MIKVYQTGSLAAQLRLAGISFAHGGVIHQGLEWFLTRLADNEEKTDQEEYTDSAIAHFDLKEGHYQIEVVFQEDRFDFGSVQVEKNTLTDCVFILKNSAPFDEDAEYFAETNPETEYDRRVEDRNVESRFGNIVTSLKNPFQEKGQGIQLQTHPLLADKAQFDGMPPEITVDPQKNESAMEKQLQLQLQLQQQNTNQNNMSPPTPTSPG